ncbi:glycosyltransferase family 2 protein [Hyphomonas jannaschiana]|uniref:Glycosyl transferase group 2 family protein n=1 Tax=Hyphomonas jannaschiana VP2 TaxID=1280952 RepID=A0A059F7V9_9PROT|nr:glycosyltransferase family 2 protein [Hyphomonas jannaschiana]KCZ86666.1 glycosyl transferase group 2 family protein [Hyphomonas jannaschiana VP2]
MSLPAISALVVSYKTGPRLHEALYALKGDPDITEIILVDNGNPPADEAWIDRFVAACPKARLIREGDNPGFGAAMNRAAGQARGDLLLACNPDCVIKRGAMRPMADALESAPRPAIVGGRIFGLDGREERGARRNTLTLWNAIGLGRWALDGTPEPDGPVRVGAVTGAFFLIRAEDYRALGGFDEAYFLHVEDVDLCRRAIEAGGSVTYQPKAGALHYTSTSDAPRDKVQAHKAASLKRYFRKFAKTPGEKIAAALMVPLIGLAMRLRG